MKCINCGGNVGAEQEHCPYCNTVNPEAIKKKKLLNLRSFMNQKLKYHTIKGSKGYRFNYVLNWAIAAMAVIFIFIMGLDFLRYLNQESARPLLRDNNAIQAEMDDYYENKELDKLYHLMRIEDLFGKDDYLYSQAALIFMKYDKYAYTRNDLIDKIQDGRYEEENITTVIEEGCEVLNISIPYYPDIHEDNEPILSAYREEVKAFFKGYLKMSEAEVLSLIGENDPYRDNQEAVLQKIKMRMGGEDESKR